MLDPKEEKALRGWYRRPEVLDTARRLIDREEWEELEEHLQMRCLLPLSRHSELPPDLRREDGSPLFPTNLDPRRDESLYAAAIAVGYDVLEKETGISRQFILDRRSREQEEDWSRFIASVEERRRKDPGGSA